MFVRDPPSSVTKLGARSEVLARFKLETSRGLNESPTLSSWLMATSFEIGAPLHRRGFKVIYYISPNWGLARVSRAQASNADVDIALHLPFEQDCTPTAASIGGICGPSLAVKF